MHPQKEIRELIEMLNNRTLHAMIRVSDLAFISSELCKNADDDDVIYESDKEYDESNEY